MNIWIAEMSTVTTSGIVFLFYWVGVFFLGGGGGECKYSNLILGLEFFVVASVGFRLNHLQQHWEKPTSSHNTLSPYDVMLNTTHK